ncbi:putative quinol monooxygenase [Rhizobium viscosum]|uniref:Quinol monooxygenase YgiN n=1 Tax=Rhizobium viscosum TaxID=1673 RepID=A0ABR9IUZ8_RHIVS|nr:putative quinol monooxygenase [Rhizobium viscosum]MBE1506948.1 quinol monooxygenase YgiN [Rhizobium viscosum]MBE1508616.1 quinol monooxygenase YgiN [Rhizobium viscosum]
MSQSLVKITASLTAHPGKAEELRGLLLDMAPHCRAEPGNLRWDVWRDTEMPECYVLDELYRDAEATEAHRRTPHYQAYLARVPALADRSARILEPVALEE